MLSPLALAPLVLPLTREDYSAPEQSPLRIGCKMSVMVTQSGVVLDNVTRWKWVKAIGNHQYAPCVNWRRPWFIAPSCSVHTCWIYSFFSLCRLAQGQVRVPFSAAHPRHHAVLWHFVMDSTEKGPCTFKMNWAPSMGWHSDWVTVQWGKWCTRLPVAPLIHLPLSVFHHLISHVGLSVSFYLQTQTERGQLWVF